MIWKIGFIATVVSVVSVPTWGWGATLTVGPQFGTDYSSVSAAVINASSGDVILIGDGIYSTTSGESFPILLTRGVLMQAAAGAKPVLRGNGDQTLTRSLVPGPISIDGITFTGGGGSSDGGAIQLRSAQAVIRNCTFLQNEQIAGAGAGVYAERGEVLIENCLFFENRVQSQGNHDSGAAAYLDTAQFTVRNCRFIRNRTEGNEPFGGAVFTNGDGMIEGCFFLDNFANAWGGGLWSDGADDLTLSDCEFIGNRSRYSGGGVYFFFTSATVENCRFYGNQSSNTQSGGAMTLDGFREKPHRLEGCRFVGNFALWAGSIRSMRSSQNEITNCLFVGNRGFISGGIGADDNSESTVRFSSFIKNFPSGLTAADGGSATAQDCLFSGHPSSHIRLTASGTDATGINNLFFDSDTGIYTSPTADYTDIQTLEAENPGWSGNRVGDPKFLNATEGVWTQETVFDSAAFQSTLTDDTASWEPGQWVGQRFTLNPNIDQPIHFSIVGNTEHTITVYGDAEILGATGNPYRILDVRMANDSAATDVASATGPEKDFLGNHRPLDIIGQGRDGSEDEYDIGAIEISYQSPFLNPRSDINRDGRVDSKDLILLEEALGDRKDSGE